MQRKTYLKLTDLAAARELWFAAVGASPLAAEEIPLAQSQGRTLAEAACAKLSSPAFHGAAMDGIAVRASDTFGASEHRPKTLHIGKNAAWINTGHPLPPGADAVIMVEHVFLETRSGTAPGEGESVSIEKAAFPWQHVRKLGEDMVSTEILLPPGTLIGAYELGALAAAGIMRPLVYARPKVAIIPSGSELVPLEEFEPDALAQKAKLPEFNSLVLGALIRDAGGESLVRPIVPDDREHIREALLEAAASDADLVVINAGSSAGSHDYTPEIVASIGELFVHGVTVMPGKPTVLGRINGKPVIGAPGYPVSAIIAFEEFGQSLLSLWQSRAANDMAARRAAGEACPASPLPSRPGMEERVRVKLGRVDDTLIAVPLARGAGTVTSLSRADGIMAIAPGVEGLPADVPAPVTFIRTRNQIDGALLVIGSHDNALDLLDSFLRKANPRFSLTSAHVGSLGGLTALKAGRCHLAGSHLLNPEDGLYNRAAIKEHLAGLPLNLVRLADREQGLILPQGNPLGIASLADLARPGVSFINRQRGSGTRLLLDRQLRCLNLAPDDIDGYQNEEYTHMNVAAAVLSGRASAGLGVRSAANALGLDFISVGIEEYDLVIPLRFWDDPRMQALLAVVRDPAFTAAVTAMGGYDTARAGEVVWKFEG